MLKFENLIRNLKQKNVQFKQGLDNSDYDFIQNEFGIVFPPDLKEFYSEALPVCDYFVDWSDRSQYNINSINDRLLAPIEGILFDIEHNSFWYNPWGKKPNNLDEASFLCRKECLLNVPKLIPIYSHRYIPMDPHEINNPIFSVHQTDIIYYGENLTSYFEVEFKIKPQTDIFFDKKKRINFWSDIVEQYE